LANKTTMLEVLETILLEALEERNAVLTVKAFGACFPNNCSHSFPSRAFNKQVTPPNEVEIFEANEIIDQPEKF
jgi:hypothetical protein